MFIVILYIEADASVSLICPSSRCSTVQKVNKVGRILTLLWLHLHVLQVSTLIQMTKVCIRVSSMNIER